MTLLLAAALCAFLVTHFTVPLWSAAAVRAGFTGKDMNKPDKPAIPEIGGLCAAAGFVAGILAYLVSISFLSPDAKRAGEILACLSTFLIATMIGLADDILGWKVGLAKWQKPLLTIFASLPLVAILAGRTRVSLPLVGNADVGILYPLVLAPAAVVGASNGFNLLAGYNGLEAGLGAIILSALGLAAACLGQGPAAALSFCMAAALLAFLRYNWRPARIFPGNTMTYGVGALIACVAVLGRLEMLALFIFLPYFLDFLLLFRKGVYVEAYAKVNPDGSLELPYDRYCDTTHIAIGLLKGLKSKVYETDVVVLILGFELILTLAALALWRLNWFA